jgi:ABC-2 type transport system permease protein
MKISFEWVSFKTIVQREARRSFRVWPQAFLPSIITTILYFLIFGRIIGARIGSISGFSYTQYIAPGLIMMQIITSSYASSVSGFFAAKFQRQIQEILVSPTSPVTLLLGYMVGGVVRGLLVGLMVTIIALFFTHLHIHNFAALIVVVVLSASMFSLAGLFNAIYAKSFDDITIVPTFILAPLTYLGGVFYSLNSLPKFWQDFSLINPIVYIINAFRFGFLGLTDASIFVAFAIMVLFNSILFFSIFYLIEKGNGMRD